MKAKDLIVHLARNYKPDDELAYVLYSKGDVVCYLQQKYIRFENAELTDEEVNEVLRGMVRHHDCENGMTWLSMDIAIDNVLTEREGLK